ncbi:MAG: sodium:calcium antiporter [Candidatus Micrarchaeota archaeon]
MFVPLSVLLLSLLVLSKASDWIIEHSMVLARYFRVSELAIGFLLVAVATSLPELSVSITGALTGNSGIAVGNVLGANIADIALVLGITALVTPIVVSKREQVKLARILFAASALPILILFEPSWLVGAVLLGFFALFAYFILKEKVSMNEKTGAVGNWQALFSGVLLAGSVFLLIASANFAVLAASDVAFSIGVSKAFVAATIISMGTTLPELSVAIAGVKKKRYSLVLGNVFGSCIVNLTLVLGVAGLITKLVPNKLAFANLMAFTLLLSGMLLYFMRSHNRIIAKSEALLLLGTYALFILFAAAVELLT